MLAAEKGNLEVVKYLMETGMKNKRLIKGLSNGIGDALIRAAKNGNLEVVKYLMEIGMKNERLIEGLSKRNRRCTSVGS